MALFRNHSNEPVSRGVLEDKGHGLVDDRTHTSAGNAEEDMSSEKEFNMNIDEPYHNGGQVDDSSRLQNETAADDCITMRVSNLQNSGRAVGGRRWGSTFWKDCQPMIPGGSDSAQESKSESDNRIGEGSDYHISNEKDGGSEFDDDGQPKEVKGQRRYTDVPAENGMLSDEYYDQDDGDEQSDSMPYRGFHNSVKSNRSQSQSVNASSNHMRRNSRVVNDEDDDYGDDENHNDDADYEEDEEEGIFSCRIIFELLTMLL